MNKKIYLTIDDAPSIHMNEKVDFLLHHKIPAVFFCRGEFIKNHIDKMVYAINEGFLIGNHSYSHPYFSSISIEQCYEEILRTEGLIEECYLAANKKRPKKVLRLPYGDQGGDNKEQEIHYFLKKQEFQKLHFCKKDFIDTPWTWDTLDYKNKMIQDPNLFLQNLEIFWLQSKSESEIILLHDFDNNHKLFQVTMDFLLGKNVEFGKA